MVLEIIIPIATLLIAPVQIATSTIVGNTYNNLLETAQCLNGISGVFIVVFALLFDCQVRNRSINYNLRIQVLVGTWWLIQVASFLILTFFLNSPDVIDTLKLKVFLYFNFGINCLGLLSILFTLIYFIFSKSKCLTPSLNEEISLNP
jgi:hypothetical protein